MDTKTLSGREVLDLFIAGKTPHPPMADTIPMTMLEAGDGHFKVKARASKAHLNAMGMVHGGFAATVLDTTTGCAVYTKIDPGVLYATTDLNIKMIKQIPLDKS